MYKPHEWKVYYYEPLHGEGHDCPYRKERADIGQVDDNLTHSTQLHQVYVIPLQLCDEQAKEEEEVTKVEEGEVDAAALVTEMARGKYSERH